MEAHPGSFGLLVRDDEVAGALRRIHAHLEPGGGVLLEVETPPAGPVPAPPWSGGFWRRPDGGVITLRGTGRYDPATQVEEAVGVYELFVGVRLVETELDEWVRRFWTAAQITAAVQDAGFAGVAVAPAPEEGTLRVTARRG